MIWVAILLTAGVGFGWMTVRRRRKAAESGR